MKARIVSWQYRLMLLTLLVIASFNASASYGYYDFCLDGLYYEYYNGELEVVTADADLKEAIIPSHILVNGDYRPVTKITSVTIPETIVLIDYYAFTGCYHLNSVYITDLSAWCNINFKSASSNPAALAKHLFLNLSFP